MSTAPLFLVDVLPPLDHFTLGGPEGRHAATVKRLRVGEGLLLADGRGGLAQAVVAGVGRDTVEITITQRESVPAPAPRVVLAQALVKGDRGELAVELATEAGVDAILPWRAARCMARWELGPRGDKALARWRSTVREAAKQARRPWLPDVEEAVSTAALVRRVATVAAAVVLHEGAARLLGEVMLPPAGDLLLVVGPEGGISDDELDALSAAGAQPVRLGPEVLRASTAAAVALGALGALTGRWARPSTARRDTPSTRASSG